MRAKLLIILLISLSLGGCHFFKKKSAPDPAFSKYIEAFTSGIISKKSAIRIQLAENISLFHSQNETEENNLFSFSPGINGKITWLDARTIEFQPEEDLEPGQEYEGTFFLNKLSKVPEKLQNFEFSFQVIKPSFEFRQEGLKSINSSSFTYMQLDGTLNFADSEDPAQIEKILSLSYPDRVLPVTWTHDSTLKTSKFSIDSIPRQKSEQKLILNWDGESIHSDTRGADTLEIPAIGDDFSVLNIRAVQETDQYVLVQFSEPVMVAQNLEGLITIGNTPDLRYTIDGSEIKVYAPEALQGNYEVMVNEGIENTRSAKLGKAMTASVSFESRLPSVSIPGKGVILPGAGKLTFPFEATNLKAVDVTIIKIYSNNVTQYLQQNNMNGENDLRRVAKPIVQKTIRLDVDKGLNLQRKNRFSLDIDELLHTEPGAIYRITIGFQKSYSLYSCTGSEDENKQEEEQEYEDYYEKIDEDDSFWGRYNNSYPNGFDWQRRDDPCSNSFYNGERWASRNVLASNIGLIVKQGSHNSMLVAVTDLLSAEPLSDVQLKVLDYQQQVIQTILSGSDGLATLDLKRKPYLLIAQKGTQRGYLKLDDGSSLPLSRFKIEGDVVQNGMKGFMYGERSVWRPGDSIFLSFILEDKGDKIPDDVPVTFELYNPKNQLVKQLTSSKSLNGFYSFHTATDDDAPTGNWLAKIIAGGAKFTKTIKIETIMPNRLKINLDFGGKTYLEKNAVAPISLSAKWLFGTPAQNLRAKVDVTLKSGKTVFSKYPNYSFDDPTTTFEPETKTIFDATLNENGVARIDAAIASAERAQGVLQASFATRVFEPGGNFSIDNFTVPYHLYTGYAGIKLPPGDLLSGMLFTDRDNAVSIVHVNPSGDLIPGKARMQVELYKISWRWWWDRDEENLGNFTQDEYNQLLKKEEIILQNGTGKWNLRINSPGWGRYLLRVKDLQSGHITGKTVYIDWPGWAQREQQNNPTEASMLSFTSDKEKYDVGQEATLTIPSSKGGRGLVSIETGSKVLKTWWINTEQGQTRFKFKVSSDMAPNIFVNISLLQPHSQTANDLPIRMYGVIPIMVEDKQTILKPVIGIADVIRPEATGTLAVSERSGKAMTYTVALVDEGLLDLTRFKTPDPHASFYAREALGVKTWDLFDYVIGAWGGDLERILSIGGDGSLNRNAKPAKSNRFKPVVRFMGPFHLAKGEKKVHRFKLPPYIGSVRVMVVAGENGAYGSAEKAVEVKKPLMLLATLPRLVGPGETFRLPITVFAMEKSIKKADIRVETIDLLKSTGSSQVVTFDQPGEKMIYADIKVGAVSGIAKVKVIASSGKEKAEYIVELPVRNPNPYITVMTNADLAAGKSWTSSINPVNPAAPGKGMLEISSIPISLGKRLNYLVRYPHGCIEQTTSSVFPQLVLNQLTDLSGYLQASAERNIKAGISKIRGFQNAEGGLSYWPGDPATNEWGTNYGGHFMLEAQARGYAIPADFLTQWKNYQRNKAVSWNPSTIHYYGGELEQAYRLYLLALAKSPEVGAMNRLKEFKNLPSDAKWRLAAAYQMIGQPEIASGLIRGLSTAVKPYRQLGGTFGSEVRDRAMILETLTLMGRRKEAYNLVIQLSKELAGDSWYSTQTAAYTLIAIAKYCGANPPGQKLNFNYAINGQKKSVSSGSYISRIPFDLKQGKNAISVTNLSKQGTLFIRIANEGQPPQGTTPPLHNNPELLVMNVQYKTQSGALINPSSLKQGTDFIAEVTIKNPGNRGFYDQMALTQVFPSGWEIINTRLAENDEALKLSPSTYRDVRDDRVMTYFNIGQAQTFTYRVLLNASYLGDYFMPGVTCEAMYDQSIHAATTGTWVSVIK